MAEVKMNKLLYVKYESDRRSMTRELQIDEEGCGEVKGDSRWVEWYATYVDWREKLLDWLRDG